MAALIEKIWHGKSYFKYVVNSDDVPANLMDLMLHMLETIEHSKPKRGHWKQPTVTVVKYPRWVPDVKTSTINKINNEKQKLKKKLKEKLNTLDNLGETREYVLHILKIEKILMPHVDEIEKYFIQMAINMKKILDSLKLFFKNKK